jgi:hypothetical protein
MDQASVTQVVQRLTEALNSHPLEHLVVSQGTVYGRRYHCVEPIGGNWWEMECWCHKIFGSTGSNMWGEKGAPAPGERWYMNNRKFWFRNETDLTLFLLRWQ